MISNSRSELTAKIQKLWKNHEIIRSIVQQNLSDKLELGLLEKRNSIKISSTEKESIVKKQTKNLIKQDTAIYDEVNQIKKQISQEKQVQMVIEEGQVQPKQNTYQNKDASISFDEKSKKQLCKLCNKVYKNIVTLIGHLEKVHEVSFRQQELSLYKKSKKE